MIKTIEEIKTSARIRRVQGLLQRNGWLLSDQVLVSAFNFLTSAVLARMLGIYAFGIYSIFYIILLYLNSIQQSLIIAPMMTLGPQFDGLPQRAVFMRGMGTFQYLFSAVCCCAALLLPLGYKLHLVRARIGPGVLIAFILTIFCFQTQDWLRRFWYAAESGKAVFSNDLISYVGQVGILIGLWMVHAINVSTAFYTIALTSMLAFLVGAHKEDVWGTLREAWQAARASWHIGRSLLVANQFQWLGSQGILLIVAAIVSVNAASGMRAAITLVGPVNILYQFLDNVIPVRAAKAFQSGGRPSLVAYLKRTGGVLVLLVGLPLLGITIFAGPAITLLFGKSFAPYAPLVKLQAVYAFLALIYKGLQYYHRTIGTVGVLARSALIVSVISVGSCVILSRLYGATGGMEALVIGQIFNILIPWRAIVKKGGERR